ncbi:hypothetical protein C5F49_00355 [Nitrosopumilus oxyclinae]|uniref:Uncharacterized protein n=1 Tax=Nitrosopumilus oxyclinae TaxID=1959104 RepID=A0A7D5R9Z9_9ARCH|nr:hypothetical protein [Nitrosopumilus oxyclinae]QLH03943.1 hypothetical protein C5F49_00355 [Nitrosopumilus oxyclinae]
MTLYVPASVALIEIHPVSSKPSQPPAPLLCVKIESCLSAASSQPGNTALVVAISSSVSGEPNTIGLPYKVIACGPFGTNAELCANAVLLPNWNIK